MNPIEKLFSLIFVASVALFATADNESFQLVIGCLGMLATLWYFATGENGEQ